MADVQHEALTSTNGIHTVVSAQPANEAARLALGWGVGDVGKVAYQLDTRALWVLRGDGVGGVQWFGIGDAAQVEANTTAISGKAAVTASAPANVTKAAAAVGVATDAARADHKHDISTAAPSTIGTANAEGSATSLARSDHVHLAARRVWTWANAAARLAQSVTAGQIGLVGYQTDMDLEFELLAVTPAVRWGRLDDPSMGPWAQFFGAQGGTSNNGLNIGNVVAGTIGQRSPAPTNRSTARMRASFTTAASLGATGYFRIGGGATLGSTAFGFRYRAAFIPGVVSASMRWVYGIYDILGASTNQSPTVVTNALAIGADLSVGPNLKIYHNDAGGAASSVDLGASFPGGQAGVGYEVEFYSADGSTVTYNVLNLNTGAETSGTLSTDIPTTSALLQHGCYESNNTDSTAISVDFSYVQFSNRNR